MLDLLASIINKSFSYILNINQSIIDIAMPI